MNLRSILKSYLETQEAFEKNMRFKVTPEPLVLTYVYLNEQVSMLELAERFNLSRRSMAKVMSRLRKKPRRDYPEYVPPKALIRARRNPLKTCAHILELTDHGQKVVEDFAKSLQVGFQSHQLECVN